VLIVHANELSRDIQKASDQRNPILLPIITIYGRITLDSTPSYQASDQRQFSKLHRDTQNVILAFIRSLKEVGLPAKGEEMEAVWAVMKDKKSDYAALKAASVQVRHLAG
jgi:hypothetical protein